MGVVITLPRARQQIDQIVDYIAADNLPAALRWLDDLEALCRLLSTQPLLGQLVRTKRHENVRRHMFGNYAIYYLPIPGGVQVLRVLHGARDQP